MKIETRRRIWSWLCWAGTGLLWLFNEGIAKLLPHWAEQLVVPAGLLLFVIGGMVAPQFWWGRWRYITPLKEPTHEHVVSNAQQGIQADAASPRRLT